MNSLLNKNNRKLNSLEIICIDKILLNGSVDDFDKYDSILKEKILHRLLNPTNPPFSFKHSNPPQPSPKYISKLVDNSTQTLNLSLVPGLVWLSFTQNSIFPFQFLENCHSLTSLSVTYQNNLTISQLIPFLRVIGSRLKHLDLSGCMRLNDSAIHYISYYCRNLQTLKLCECIGIGGAVFQRAMGTTMALMPLDRAADGSPAPAPSTFPMMRMASLMELDLTGCKSIPSVNLLNISYVFPCLQEFSFAKIFLSDEDGSLLVQTLPASTRSIDLSFNPIGSKTMSALIPSGKNMTSFNLKSLSISYCRCVTTNDIQQLFYGLSNSLESLTITGCSQIDRSALLKPSNYSSVHYQSPYFKSSSKRISCSIFNDRIINNKIVQRRSVNNNII